MKADYQKWIAENVVELGYGECHHYAQKMAAAFPELTYVQGYYYCPLWGERMHGWCIDPDNNVVDPTASQFPSKGNGYYDIVKEEDAPIGKCMECGNYIYTGSYSSMFCCPECESAYARSLGL